MLKGLDHFNISTGDMAATLRFFEDVFGLEARAAPGRDGAVNSWLHDASGHAPVHVNLRESVGGDGVINHVAFACEGYAAMRERLKARGHAIREFDNRETTGARQIFVRGPEGALIELNFSDD